MTRSDMNFKKRTPVATWRTILPPTRGSGILHTFASERANAGGGRLQTQKPGADVALGETDGNIQCT